MDISFTVFNSIFDNKTDKRMDFLDFDDFEKFLYKLSNQEKSSKKDAVLISPATYQPDTTRANANVVEWSGWCAVDVDDYQPDGDLKDDLCSRFSNFRFICYSTASSTMDQPKFRLVFPLRRRVGSDRIRHFWYSLNKELGELSDAQTKDLSRMYYIPAKYAGANNFIFSHDGDTLDPQSLMDKHPYAEKANLNNFFDRLPDEIQRQIIEHRMRPTKKHRNPKSTATIQKNNECRIKSTHNEKSIRLVKDQHNMLYDKKATTANAFDRRVIVRCYAWNTSAATDSAAEVSQPRQLRATMRICRRPR